MAEHRYHLANADGEADVIEDLAALVAGIQLARLEDWRPGVREGMFGERWRGHG
jgi:hypothetical protein